MAKQITTRTLRQVSCTALRQQQCHGALPPLARQENQCPSCILSSQRFILTVFIEFNSFNYYITTISVATASAIGAGSAYFGISCLKTSRTVRTFPKRTKSCLLIAHGRKSAELELFVAVGHSIPPKNPKEERIGTFATMRTYLFHG